MLYVIMRAHFVLIYLIWRFLYSLYRKKLPKKADLCRRMGTWPMAHG